MGRDFEAETASSSRAGNPKRTAPSRSRLCTVGLITAAVLLLSDAARAQVELAFRPAFTLYEPAARIYRAIWDVYGARIVEALETRTCLPFPESEVEVEVAEAVSHSGGPGHPMRVRASYTYDFKKSTLVHELGHRHLWQLPERLEGIDSHMTLYLVLDRVWADVWGEPFADARVDGESGWRSRYDYGAAWTWARSLSAAERAELWDELLAKNGFAGGCETFDGGAP